MKEYPILFSTPMVQAILDKRKTMTRRVITHYGNTPQYYARDKFYKTIDVLNSKQGFWSGFYKDSDVFEYEGETHIDASYFKYPYGQPGNRLYVKETWADLRGMGFGNDPITNQPCNFAYKANIKPGSDSDRARIDYGVKWKSPRFMPKVAARIWLEVVSVRVERLQEITTEDVIREGLEADNEILNPDASTHESIKNWNLAWAQHLFRDLWDSINSKRGYSWDTNPYVWVIEFRRLS